jgi:hypothetical protein
MRFMFRHPALAQLSREHHLVLQLARGIQKNASAHLRATLPAEARSLAVHVNAVFASELEPHFEVEEKVLVAAVRGHDPELDALSSAIVGEHAEMRELARKLARPDLSDAAYADLLDELGIALERHVRNEERTFYARVQACLDDAALLRLSASLARYAVEHAAK